MVRPSQRVRCSTNVTHGKSAWRLTCPQSCARSKSSLAVPAADRRLVMKRSAIRPGLRAVSSDFSTHFGNPRSVGIQWIVILCHPLAGRAVVVSRVGARSTLPSACSICTTTCRYDPRGTEKPFLPSLALRVKHNQRPSAKRSELLPPTSPCR